MFVSVCMQSDDDIWKGSNSNNDGWNKTKKAAKHYRIERARENESEIRKQ